MTRKIASRTPKILIVEDEPLLREAVVDALTQAGYAVATAGSGEEALAVLRAGGIDALLTDIRLPGLIDGWRVADEFRMSAPLGPVLYATAYDPQPPRQVANSRLIRKPYRSADLLDALAALCRPAPAETLKVA